MTVSPEAALTRAGRLDAAPRLRAVPEACIGGEGVPHELARALRRLRPGDPGGLRGLFPYPGRRGTLGRAGGARR